MTLKEILSVGEVGVVKYGCPSTVALESVILIYEFGFFKLGFRNCHFEVMKGNLKVADFHKRFGAKVVSEDETRFYFTSFD